MSIDRKWAFARTVVWDHDTCNPWVAESRAGTGTWVVVANDPTDPDNVSGRFFDFDDDHEGTLLYMTPEQREAMGMSDAVYAELNAALMESQALFHIRCGKVDRLRRDLRGLVDEDAKPLINELLNMASESRAFLHHLRPFDVPEDAESRLDDVEARLETLEGMIVP
jgi:hypothetical protein